MLKKIDGRVIADRIKDKLAKDIFKLSGPRPNLAIILVGERSDSQLYVSLKEKEGKKVGIDTHLYCLAADVEEKEILEVIDFLNKDKLIDGIIVQLPLPEKFNTDKIIASIDSQKDADAFHAQKQDHLLSPVLASILACLDEIKFNSLGKTASVLYNSDIFGKSVKSILEARGIKVNLQTKSDQADLVITALGKAHYLKKEMIKKDAVIIDIGISKVGTHVQGDVDYDDIKTKAAYLTPVPGGIGPMTIAFLFKNTWEIFKRRNL